MPYIDWSGREQEDMERDNMREENFGPVANPDGSPTETTLEIMGFKRRVGDTFTWYNEFTSEEAVLEILRFTATGVIVYYAGYDGPKNDEWEIPFSEAM